MIKTAHEFARSKSKLSSYRTKMYYDTNSLEQLTILVHLSGYIIQRERKGVSLKPCRKRERPYIVVKRLYISFRSLIGPRSKPTIVHWDRLWRYNGDNPPKWFYQISTDAQLNHSDQELINHVKMKEDRHQRVMPKYYG